MATAQDTQILYIAYFGRPADPSGFLYWTTGPQKALSLNEVADYFAQDTEYKQTTKGLTPAQVINSFYVNLFGRDADQPGLEYWLLRTQPGDEPGKSKVPGEDLIDVQDVGYYIALGALEQAAGAPDRVVLESKLTAADKWTDLCGQDAAANNNYNGELAATYGVDFLKVVKSPATIPSDAATKAALDLIPPFGTVGLVRSSASSASEGTSVTFTVTTIPSLAGQNLSYELTGVQSADVVGGKLSGSAVIGATGVAVITVSIATDALIETGEILGIVFPNQIIAPEPVGSDSVALIDETDPNLQVVASSTAITEGNTLTFFITSTNLPAGTIIDYDLSGTGLTSADVNNAPLQGTTVLNASGQSQVAFVISKDLSTESPETVIFTATAGTTTASATSVINDTSSTPIPSVQVNPSAASVNEGGTLTFFISTENISAGTLVDYTLSGANLTSADVNNAPLTGTVTVNALGQAQVTFNISQDLSIEGPEAVTFTVTIAGLSDTATSVINDTSLPAANYTLTTNQDIVAGGAVAVFTFNGNEDTLGQGDQLSIGQAANAVLKLKVAGQFNFDNFETDGVQTFIIDGNGVLADGNSSMQMSDVIGITDIEIIQNIQKSVLFEDLQVGQLDVLLKDSLGDYEFNFDDSFVKNKPGNAVTFTLDEIPVDAVDTGVGLILTQGPSRGNAEVETVNIVSQNTSGNDDTNLTNLISRLVVGPALQTLNIDGTTSVNIEEDLGVSGNTLITRIDADGLFADLTLAYTTSVQDVQPANKVPDVVVLGAQGDNTLTFASNGPLPADFSVTTFAGDDFVTTTDGDDTLSLGEGNNTADAGNGNNHVTAGDGNNTITTGTGNDGIILGEGNNTVAAGDGQNTVTVGDGDNSITSGKDADTISAGIGKNFINAGDGNNVVRAGADASGNPLPDSEFGSNKVLTGSGNDDIATGDGVDVIASGNGNDLIVSNAGADLVIAGNGNNTVNSGSGADNVAIGNGADTVELGSENDTLWIKADNLTSADSIDGDGGTADTILFTAGGVVDQSDSSGVFNVEQFTLNNLLGLDPAALKALLDSIDQHEAIQARLTEILAGPQADYDITLGTALVEGSNNLVGNVRRFTIDATEALADVTVDTSEVAIRGTDRNFLAVSYFGSSEGYDERLIVSEASLSSRLIADFDDRRESQGDVLELLGNATGKTAITATIDDLSGIRDVDVIELNTLSNLGQDFYIYLDQDFINRNASASDPLFIRATNGLPAGSRLFLDVSAVTSSGLTRSIVVQKTTNLTVNVTGDPAIGTAAAKVQVVDSGSNLFFTSNADDLNGTSNGDLIVAGSANDLSIADSLDAGAGFDTLLIEFPVTRADIEFAPLVDVFDLPARTAPAVGQANGFVPSPELVSTTGWVSLLGQYPYVGDLPKMMGGLSGLDLLGLFKKQISSAGAPGVQAGFTFDGLPILDDFVRQVNNLLTTPVNVDPTTFPGLYITGAPVNGGFVSASLPDFPQYGQRGGISIAGLPFPSFVDVEGATLESQLNFVDVENVEKYQFNPPNDNAVRFVGFNSNEFFKTPGPSSQFNGFDQFVDAQRNGLDLVSLEILQTFDTSRNPNAGNGNAIIEGFGAPLNDILFLDDFSWNTSTATDAERYWNNVAEDTYQVQVLNFKNAGGNFFAGFQAKPDFDRYVKGDSLNDFEYGSFFDGDSEKQRRSGRFTFAEFALEVDTGAGNDYIWRGTFGPSGAKTATVRAIDASGNPAKDPSGNPIFETGGQEVGGTLGASYFAGYLVDTGSGDDVVTLDAIVYWQGLDGIRDYGLFGGYNFTGDPSGNIFEQAGNPFYDASGNLKVGWSEPLEIIGGTTAFADDVILTRSGNDFIVDFGGDNIVYSGIGNDYVLTGYGNDFIISDDEDQTLLGAAASASGGEVIAGPGAKNDTDNDIVIADGPVVPSFLQLRVSNNPPGITNPNPYNLLAQASPGVFGQDYVRDLKGDNIISTGGNDDTVVTGLGDDIILAGTIGDLDPSGNGVALYNDSDVINDLGGHNLIVTLGDDDYIEDGNGSSVILAGFGSDNDVVFANGGADFIEIASGDDYVDAGTGDDFIASLLGASDAELSLTSGDWNGISTGDTLLGGTGFDTYLTAFGGSQDDIVIAPRLVLTSNTDGVPTTVSGRPNPGSYPASYADAANGYVDPTPGSLAARGSVNPIMDSIEALILFSDDADIYLTDTVAQQARNPVVLDSSGNVVSQPQITSQVSVFLNDLDYQKNSGVDIVLDASAFEADSSLRAFAFNIGASDLQSGIQASAGLIGGSGVDFLAAGSALQEGILGGPNTDVATLLDQFRSFLDNQALDNFVGADVSTILGNILDAAGTGIAQFFQSTIFPNYPDPITSVDDIQNVLNIVFDLLKGDFVEDYITYQGNGGGDFVTLEPTVLDGNGLPLVNENTVEFVRYETTRDGANAGVAAGFDQIFNFNNSDTFLPYENFFADNKGVLAPTNPVSEGALTNDNKFLPAATSITSTIEETNGLGTITGDKIVLGGNADQVGKGVGQLGDIVSKNGNQLVDLFKVNAAVNWSSGRQTNVLDATGAVIGQFLSGDEALFVDYAIQATNDQITNFSDIVDKINTFGSIVDSLNQGGLIVVNGGDKAIFAVYQETDGDFAKIDQSEVSILGLVQGIDTNSFRLQASDFIIDNSFVTYQTGTQFNFGGPLSTTPALPTSGNVWDGQPVTDPAKPPFTNSIGVPPVYTGDTGL